MDVFDECQTICNRTITLSNTIVRVQRVCSVTRWVALIIWIIAVYSGFANNEWLATTLTVFLGSQLLHMSAAREAPRWKPIACYAKAMHDFAGHVAAQQYRTSIEDNIAALNATWTVAARAANSERRSTDGNAIKRVKRYDKLVSLYPRLIDYYQSRPLPPGV